MGISLPPYRQRLPVIWESHIFEVKQSAVGFQQFFQISLEIAVRADYGKDISNTGKKRKEFVGAYRLDCCPIHKRIYGVVRENDTHHEASVPYPAMMGATITKIGYGV